MDDKLKVLVRRWATMCHQNSVKVPYYALIFKSLGATCDETPFCKKTFPLFGVFMMAVESAILYFGPKSAVGVKLWCKGPSTWIPSFSNSSNQSVIPSALWMEALPPRKITLVRIERFHHRLKEIIQNNFALIWGHTMPAKWLPHHQTWNILLAYATHKM